MDALDDILDLLRCPHCRSPLERSSADHLTCRTGHVLPLRDGRIPDLAGEVHQEETPGQWFMRFRPLVQVYERVWRPAFTLAAGGTDPDRETAQLLEWLDLAPEATVVDVACGPGNTTRRLAAGIGRGRVVGVDLSLPMLERAVRESVAGAARVTVTYVRGDAHRLPLADECADATHCAAALYLVSDPQDVVDEMARVLRPGGRLVGMTLAPWPALPAAPVSRRLAGAVSGIRYVQPGDLDGWATAAGLTDFRHQRRGAAVLFQARRR